MGPDGSSIKMTTTSPRHDGEEVHSSVTQDIRLQRIGQLQAIGAKSKLGGTKKPDQLRLFMTRLDPDTEPKDIECTLLEDYPFRTGYSDGQETQNGEK